MINVLRIAKLKVIVSIRIVMQEAIQNIFRYWHIVHLPIAISMFMTMIFN
jgi:hypothetical protein